MQVLSKSLVVAEEKCFVSLERASHGTAKLVTLERRSVSLIEEIRCIQRVITQKLKCRPVPLIRSRLRQDNHLPSGAFAKFSPVRVALHIEFTHRVYSQKHAARSPWLH